MAENKLTFNKKLIVFDLDGTLTESKASPDKEMARLFTQLLGQKKIAVISGGRYEQFQDQFLEHLHLSPALMRNLWLFPTTATSMYEYRKGPGSASQGGWRRVYAHMLPLKTRRKIIKTFNDVFKELGYQHPKKVYGELIQDRGTQIAFTAVGQDIVEQLGAKRGVAIKLAFRKTGWREKIAAAMQKKLPELEAKAGGYSTVDVVRKGIDKGYGILQIQKHLHIPIKDMIFIGDQIVPGGNDYAVVKTGVDYIQVPGPKEAKQVIKKLLAKV